MLLWAHRKMLGAMWTLPSDQVSTEIAKRKPKTMRKALSKPARSACDMARGAKLSLFEPIWEWTKTKHRSISCFQLVIFCRCLILFFFHLIRKDSELWTVCLPIGFSKKIHAKPRDMNFHVHGARGKFQAADALGKTQQRWADADQPQYHWIGTIYRKPMDFTIKRIWVFPVSFPIIQPEETSDALLGYGRLVVFVAFALWKWLYIFIYMTVHLSCGDACPHSKKYEWEIQTYFSFWYFLNSLPTRWFHDPIHSFVARQSCNFRQRHRWVSWVLVGIVSKPCFSHGNWHTLAFPLITFSFIQTVSIFILAMHIYFLSELCTSMHYIIIIMFECHDRL